MVKRFIISFSSLLFAFSANGQQSAVGQWEFFQSFNQLINLQEYRGSIFSAGPGGMFSYDPQSGEVRRFNTLDGMYRLNVSLLDYYEFADVLVLGYQDGTIQMFDGNSFTTISDIKNANIIGSRIPLSVANRENRLYLGFGFGLVSLRFTETDGYLIDFGVRNLLESGDQVEVLDIAFLADSIYITTSKGFFAAKETDNLLDFNAWKLLDTRLFSNLIEWDGNLVLTMGTDIYLLEDGLLNPTPTTFAWSILSRLEDELYGLGSKDGRACLVRFISKNFDFDTTSVLSPSNTSGLLQTPSGIYYSVSDVNGGLLYEPNDQDTLLPLQPNGPLLNFANRLEYLRDTIYAATGGYSSATNPTFNAAGLMAGSQGEWTSYSWITGVLPFGVFDIMDVAYNPFNETLYFTNLGQGLFAVNDTGIATFTPDNSPISMVSGAPDQGRCTGLFVDNEGTLWLADFFPSDNNPVSILTLDLEGNWTTYSHENQNAEGPNVFPEDIIMDLNNNIWVRNMPSRSTAGGQTFGLWVLNPRTRETVNINMGEDQLPDTRVFSFEVDLDGTVWLGTGKGVAAYYSPAEVFTSTSAVWPIFEGRPVLENHVVTAIAVDGANRKWFGTQDAGAWLLNEDATEQVLYFNQENSPLPSNNVLDIAIDQSTGVVYMSTDGGIVSYRGDATDIDYSKGCETIFPNPVRPDYEGLLTINCLPDNAIVKITDAAGYLAYENEANGNSLSWDLRDYNGRKISAGVYYIFAKTDQGSETLFGQFAVVR